MSLIVPGMDHLMSPTLTMAFAPTIMETMFGQGFLAATVFFIVLGVFQLVWIRVLLKSNNLSLLSLGILGNLVSISIYFISTSGVTIFGVPPQPLIPFGVQGVGGGLRPSVTLRAQSAKDEQPSVISEKWRFVSEFFGLFVFHKFPYAERDGPACAIRFMRSVPSNSFLRGRVSWHGMLLMPFGVHFGKPPTISDGTVLLRIAAFASSFG